MTDRRQFLTKALGATAAAVVGEGVLRSAVTPRVLPPTIDLVRVKTPRDEIQVQAAQDAIVRAPLAGITIFGLRTIPFSSTR